jgi:putative membrane-bound dehydrogenase-like protein
MHERLEEQDGTRGVVNRRFISVRHIQDNRGLCALLTAAALFLCNASFSAAAEQAPGNLPRSTAVVSGSFRVAPGFRLELAASEPLVTMPVAMAFDENGRLFVVEMRDYPNQRDARPHLGRIRVLEDPDENGVFQSSAIYAEDLPLPSAVASYAGGIFVAATPDITYFKATQGGAADVIKTVLTGFGGTNAPDASRLLNNFNWGLDNRIHGATAGLGGIISSSNWPSGPVSLTGCDFSFDPRSLAVFAESGSAQSGLTLDGWGRRFASDLARPLLTPMSEPRYTERNPFCPSAPSLVDAASTATPIFRFAGPARGTNEPVAGWLTNAQGCVVYRGSAYPTNYQGNVFIADPEAHVVHRMVLRQNGLELSAERAPGERFTEFVLSRDDSFHPVQLVNGPDGVLYVADRQTGGERGRIYRLVPENFKHAKAPQLGKVRTADLVAALASPDGWHADTAARLLFERSDAAATPLLGRMAVQAGPPLARLRALYVLDGSGLLNETLVLKALQDTDARLREQAVLLAEHLLTDGSISDGLWNQLRTMTADASPRVRYQLALTAGEIRRPEKPALLADILARDLADPWMQSAVLSSAAEGAGELFILLARTASFRNSRAGLEFLRQLATMIGLRGRLDDVMRAGRFAVQGPLPQGQAFALLYSVGEGLRRTRSSLSMLDPQGTLGNSYNQALNVAVDTTIVEPVRVEALRVLGLSPYTLNDTSDWLVLLAQAYATPALQTAALTVLAHYDDPRAVRLVLDCWPSLSAPLRNHAIAALLSRTSHLSAVLDAVQARRIAPEELSATQKNFLRSYPDATVSDRAVQFFGELPFRRAEVVERFKPALKLLGSAERGRQLFAVRCADCHLIDGRGQNLGPNLAGARTKGKLFILGAILEPHASVAPEYATCVVETKEGENVVGIESDDNLTTITVRQPRGDQVVWPKSNVQSIRTTKWSMMPDGLEAGLSPQDMADLLDYLMTGR